MQEYSTRKVDENLLKEIVEKILSVTQPEKIILFGSHARGDATEESDVDIFIIQHSDLPRHKRSTPIRLALLGIFVPKDILVYTPEEVEEWRSAPTSFIATVLREGRVLYERERYMKNNGDVARGLMLKAESDIRTLTILIESEAALDTAYFHAQQAAEKYLKAFLCFNDVIPSRTHSVQQLLELCAKINEQFSDLIVETAFLRDYAVELRYDVGFWPEKPEVEAAFEAVDKIRRLVLSALPEEMHPSKR